MDIHIIRLRFITIQVGRQSAKVDYPPFESSPARCALLLPGLAADGCARIYPWSS